MHKNWLATNTKKKRKKERNDECNNQNIFKISGEEKEIHWKIIKTF
jgi:hypothetical protein